MKKIYNSRFFVFIMFITFFKPIFLQYYSSLQIFDTLYDLLKILVIFIIIFEKFTKDYPIIKISKVLVSIICFGVWGIFVTIIKSGIVFKAFTDALTIFAVFIFINRCLEINSKQNIKIMSNTINFIIVLQLLVEIIYPSGLPADLYKNPFNPLYFITVDNGTAQLTILGVTLNIIKNKISSTKKSFINTYFPILLCILTAFFSHSTTAIICTLFMSFFPSLNKLLKKNSAFNKPKTWIMFYILIFIVVMFGSYSQLFNNIMLSLTGKSGFTGRNILWSKAIELIKASPIIGYGRQARDYISVWGGYYSSHNVILEVMLQSGIIGLILWGNSIISSFKNIKKYKFYKNDYFRIILASIFMLLISLMMEINIYSTYLFIMLSILYTLNINHKSEVPNE